MFSIFPPNQPYHFTNETSSLTGQQFNTELLSFTTKTQKKDG